MSFLTSFNKALVSTVSNSNNSFILFYYISYIIYTSFFKAILESLYTILL